MSLSRAAHALWALLPAPYPSPCSRLPGYLRLMTAEAAPIHAAVEALAPAQPPSAAAAAAAAAADLAHQAAARRAYVDLVDIITRRVMEEAQAAPHTPAHEGLQLLEDQRRAGAEGSSVVIPHVSRALAAVRYHQRMMDGTPRGRKLQEDWQRQVILETRAVEAAAARYRREAEAAVQRGSGAALPAARRLLVGWFHPLAESIRAEQYRVVKGTPGVDRSVYGPYLLRLDPEQLAVIAMHAGINAFMSPEGDSDAMGSAPGTARMTRLAVAIGRAVEAQHNVNQLEEVCHQQNMRRTEVQGAYTAGRALREVYDSRGHLTDEEWQEWFSTGNRLRSLGEMLPLDHLEWFIDQSYEERLQKMAAKYRLPEATAGNQMSQLAARARRLLSDTRGDGEWRGDVLAKVGVILIKHLIEACNIDVTEGGKVTTVPAFWHKLELGPDARARGLWKRYGLLLAHPEVMRRIKPHQMAEAFMPQFLPMVVPPVPWQRHNLGGHLTLRSAVMRVRGSYSQRERLAQADRQMVEGRGPGLSQVYDALNALGETAWCINTDVYKVVEAVWAWGGGICDVPRREDVGVPARLHGGFRLHRDSPGQLQLYAHPRGDVRARAYDVQRAGKKNNELHSLRCDMEYKLAIAREFSRETRFYFPHNVDFRGRAYPMHPHLNHLGSDMCRGLLQFADTRPLGPNGLKWLYVQAANLWGQGVDKLPLEGRAKWVQDNLGTILDNAADPFRRPPGVHTPDPSAADFGDPSSSEGAAGAGHALLQALLTQSADRSTPYWFKAESPFQFLATCFEIYNALASADPASYRSRLPVHQDGSCNGLQHYAALGRDLTGGWAVNLCPVDRPQDVYTEISRLVKKRVEEDAAAGVPEAQTLLASTEVDRKLVKQTVMTSVYGVTFVGARAQIGNRLKERGFEDNHMMYRVSCYSARITLDCLHEMFHSAKHIMQWLSECARLVARKGRAVGWVTPLGLPVVQPYRRKTRQHVRTVLQRLVLVENHDDLPVMKQRQRTAFPPNYIHSVDSSHMMLTALACRDAGLDFAGVHDSFWTHAGSLETMNSLLRDTFVQLHSQPLLETLLEDMQKEHPDIEFPPLPPRGELNLEEIRGAAYFFS